MTQPSESIDPLRELSPEEIPIFMNAVEGEPLDDEVLKHVEDSTTTNRFIDLSPDFHTAMRDVAQEEAIVDITSKMRKLTLKTAPTAGLALSNDVLSGLICGAVQRISKRMNVVVPLKQLPDVLTELEKRFLRRTDSDTTLPSP